MGEKAYLYASLLRLGFVDRDQLRRFEDMPLKAEEFGISDEQARELSEQARQMFERYFQNSEPLSANGYALCDL